jgi:hypothetical protein
LLTAEACVHNVAPQGLRHSKLVRTADSRRLGWTGLDWTGLDWTVGAFLSNVAISKQGGVTVREKYCRHLATIFYGSEGFFSSAFFSSFSFRLNLDLFLLSLASFLLNYNVAYVNANTPNNNAIWGNTVAIGEDK